jgi:hypothetical protein
VQRERKLGAYTGPMGGLKGLGLPGNVGPPRDHILAGLEDVLAGDDDVECWLFVLLPGYRAHEPNS